MCNSPHRKILRTKQSSLVLSQLFKIFPCRYVYMRAFVCLCMCLCERVLWVYFWAILYVCMFYVCCNTCIYANMQSYVMQMYVLMYVRWILMHTCAIIQSCVCYANVCAHICWLSFDAYVWKYAELRMLMQMCVLIYAPHTCVLYIHTWMRAYNAYVHIHTHKSVGM